jgi:hypothetical protein
MASPFRWRRFSPSDQVAITQETLVQYAVALEVQYSRICMKDLAIRVVMVEMSTAQERGKLSSAIGTTKLVMPTDGLV